MSLELWPLRCAAAAGLSLTHGACFGFRPAICTVLGGALGFFVLIAAPLAGMGALGGGLRAGFHDRHMVRRGRFFSKRGRPSRAPAR